MGKAHLGLDVQQGEHVVAVDQALLDTPVVAAEESKRRKELTYEPAGGSRGQQGAAGGSTGSQRGATYEGTATAG